MKADNLIIFNICKNSFTSKILIMCYSYILDSEQRNESIDFSVI